MSDHPLRDEAERLKRVEPTCERCGWSLAKTRQEGCVPGDCSFRCPVCRDIRATARWHPMSECDHLDTSGSCAEGWALCADCGELIDAVDLCGHLGQLVGELRAELAGLKRHATAMRGEILSAVGADGETADPLAEVRRIGRMTREANLLCPDCQQPIVVEIQCGYINGTRCGCPEKHYHEQDRQVRERVKAEKDK